MLSDTALDLVELRARGRYDPARAVLPALARSIAERRCLDRLRRHYHRPSRSLEELAPVDPAPRVEEQVVSSEAVRAWRGAFRLAFRELQRADRTYRSRRAAVVYLRYRFAIQEDEYTFLSGRASPPRDLLPSWQEVAEQLGMTEETARQNGSRGLKALRELWQRYCPPELRS